MSMFKKIALRQRRKQSGLGIIEVLVALVVVSFGVLGMASLQLTGMKHSSGGFNRSKALLFAQSMATRIRVNTAVVTAGGEAYKNFDSKTNVSCGAPPVPYCQARENVGTTASCTPSELAVFDLYSVSCGDLGAAGAEKGIIGSLPNGSMTVECASDPCVPGSAYEVTVNWTEGRSKMDPDKLVTKRVQVKLRP